MEKARVSVETFFNQNFLDGLTKLMSWVIGRGKLENGNYFSLLSELKDIKIQGYLKPSQ